MRSINFSTFLLTIDRAIGNNLRISLTSLKLMKGGMSLSPAGISDLKIGLSVLGYISLHKNALAAESHPLGGL